MNTRSPIRIGQFNPAMAERMAKWRADVDAAAKKATAGWAPAPAAFAPACYLYIMRVARRNPDGLSSHAIKVGVSNNPAKRATGFHNATVLFQQGYASREQALLVEAAVHAALQNYALPTGEAQQFIAVESARGASEFFQSGHVPEELALAVAHANQG